jgi:membrane protein DedA with SNARE-associated domain
MKGKITLLVGGAVGYVLGTRAGRERYDRFVDWVRSMRSKIERRDDVSEVEPSPSRMTTGSTSPTGMPVPGP